MEEESEEWSDALDHIPPPPHPPPPPQPLFTDQLPSTPSPSPPAATITISPLPPPPPTNGDDYDSNNPPSPSPPDTEDTDDTSARKKKQKTLSSLPSDILTPANAPTEEATPLLLPGSKKSSKKKSNNNVWSKSTSRKGKKKTKSSATMRNAAAVAPEDHVFISPIPRFPDKTDDSPESTICLSRAYKAEKVDLSEDRLSAGSTKGYRMVRATRGVNEGAWYFEIKVAKLGETGHTRLGWTTDKGDLQAPVGFDGNSYGYRDVDGSKVHKALREKYGEEGYFEGDVIGFYINLPEGRLYAPKPPHYVWYKGQRYMYTSEGKDEPLKTVPGSEIRFYKNGVCQGVAFRDVFGGRYYPAASLYTLPNQPNCEVKFNFGPDFDSPPQDFNNCPPPRPMIEVPYHGYDGRVGTAVENNITEKKD